jgi:very-short-patch-repair endonuclease
MGSGGKDDFTEDEVTLTARLGEEWSAGTGEAVLPEPPEAVAMGETSQEASVLPRNTADAVAFLRRKLLDIGKRNRLINTPLRNARAKQLRVVDELSDEVFRLLVTEKRKMSFLAVPEAQAKGEEEDAADDGQLVYVPPADDEVEEGALAARHTDLNLQTSYKAEPLQKRLLGLSRDAKTLEEEQGISVLFLALGFLKWFESESSDVERYAPLIIVPVNLVRDDIRGRFKLELRDEDMQLNLSLQAMLESDHGLSLPDLPDQDGWQPSDYFGTIEELVSDKARWTVERDEIVLGFYSFAKFLMWRDLDPENWPEGSGIAGNKLLDDLLVDGFAPEERVVGEDQNLDEAFPDPAALFHIMDADASQTQVIAAARAGRNLVVQGPPGTGKSQTIANIIATAVADGRKVLFVAEKMTALTVVHDRLAQRGLDHACLELHSNKANKMALLQELGRTLDAARPRAVDSAAYGETRELRDKLNRLSKLLHDRDQASERSPFEVLGEIVKLRELGATTPSFELPHTSTWDRATVAAAVRDVKAFSEVTKQYGVETEHAWRGVTRRLSPMDRERLSPLVDLALSKLELLHRLAHKAAEICSDENELTPNACEALAPMLEALERRPAHLGRLCSNPDALAELDRVAELCEMVRSLSAKEAALTEQVIDAALEMDWTEVRAQIAGHGQSFFRLFNGKFRDAVQKLRSVCKGLLPDAHNDRLELLDALLERARLAKQLQRNAEFGALVFGSRWREQETDVAEVEAACAWLQSSTPLFGGLENLTHIANALEDDDTDIRARPLKDALTDCVSALGTVAEMLGLEMPMAFGVEQLLHVPLNALRSRFAEWQSDPEGIVSWFQVNQAAQRCRDAGLGVLCDRVNDGEILPDDATGQFKYAWAEALWNRLVGENVELTDIDGSQRHDQVARFRHLDGTLKDLAAQEIALKHYEGMPRGGAGAMGIIRSEIAKRRRHMSVRKLMDLAGAAIVQIKPVFMMSPLSVSQYLKPGNIRFDLLVIDEASQVKPEDALGAIIRSDQFIVVGDQKQLPPTSFFDRSMADDEQDDDEQDGDADADVIGRAAARQVASMESILSLCHARDMHGDVLRWHYRSEHPSLIEVSNHQFYDDRLIYPPSPEQGAIHSGLTFHRVNGIYDRGRTRQNQIEAQAVAEAVMEHARNSPHLTLGVATFSAAQRDAILNRVEHLRADSPELESFFSEGKRERFFVKSLENVQGDERDVIFVSIGYGPDEKGYMTQSFGPVSADGGERRLNVLFTRAKKSCRVYSSISHNDIRLDASVNPGRQALARFLKYAELGDLDVPTVTGDGTDSPFEDAVLAALVRHGYEVQTQVGSAGFRIDLAVCDPNRPGHFVLGVECDGAAYHSSRWARERDRLRQNVLEAKGWVIHRIWSTDWFERPDAELQRLLAAVERQLYATEKAPEPAPKVAEAPVVLRELVEEPVQSKALEYAEANFILGDTRLYQVHEAPSALICASLRKIVEVEAPIHIEELARRLSTLWGNSRTGSRIQAVVWEGVEQLVSQGQVQWCEFEPHAFVDQPTRQGELPPVRDRGDVTSATLRKPTFIPLSEILSASLQSIEQCGAISEEDLGREVGGQLGFKATSKDLRERISAALQLAQDRGFIEIADGLLQVTATAPERQSSE